MAISKNTLDSFNKSEYELVFASATYEQDYWTYSPFVCPNIYYDAIHDCYVAQDYVIGNSHDESFYHNIRTGTKEDMLFYLRETGNSFYQRFPTFPDPQMGSRIYAHRVTALANKQAYWAFLNAIWALSHHFPC